ncbi:hypothetical protein PLEOSDRAFT_168789 [Pleurotus ostreatus PC15]|uniref:Uncharacterized protein n=1 Tax=Pleurotus ostreatus (strain PC15) TaxID=1137138 RepID=A0A067NS49_PLEO1|nr:hypothetical protein PLEOSDRAFT_168789 [Pleurotus ostreatus PC15]
MPMPIPYTTVTNRGDLIMHTYTYMFCCSVRFRKRPSSVDIYILVPVSYKRCCDARCCGAGLRAVGLGDAAVPCSAATYLGDAVTPGPAGEGPTVPRSKVRCIGVTGATRYLGRGAAGFLLWDLAKRIIIDHNVGFFGSYGL